MAKEPSSALVDIISDLIVKRGSQIAKQLAIIGTVSAVDEANSRIQLQRENEGAASTKYYRYLGSHLPAVNDEVVCLKIGGSLVVLGSFASGARDDHAIYAKLLGRNPAQVLFGGTEAGQNFRIGANDTGDGDVQIDAAALDLSTFSASLQLNRITDSNPTQNDQGTQAFRTDYGLVTTRASAAYRPHTSGIEMLREDWILAAVTGSGWVGAAIGAGTGVIQGGEVENPGILRLSSSAGAANTGYSIHRGQNVWTASGDEVLSILCRFSPVDANMRVRFGMGDAAAGTGTDTDAVGFEDDGAGGIRGYTYNNGTKSTTATIFTPSANTWYWLQAMINTPNSIVFKALSAVNGAVQGTTPAAITTNIPSATARVCGPQLRFWSGNTTLHTADIDVFWLWGSIARNPIQAAP